MKIKAKQIVFVEFVIIFFLLSGIAFAQKGFDLFYAEAQKTKNEIGCPKPVDSDIVPAMYEGDGSLYGCILGKEQTVKWFINAMPNSDKIKSVKFLWNDYFKNLTIYNELHQDRKEAHKALQALIKMYAPEKTKELNRIFFENKNATVSSEKFILNYTYNRGPAIDERMIIVTEK